MALIVEDGTGLSNADALISVVWADTFFTDRNITSWTSVAQLIEKEAAIREASSYLMNSFTWKGYPTGLRDQTMAFPRVDLIDRYGYNVPSDAVPREAQEATAVVALYAYENPGIFRDTAYEPQKILKRKKTGPLEKEYAIFNQDKSSARPSILYALDLLQPFMADSGDGGGLVGQRKRG